MNWPPFLPLGLVPDLRRRTSVDARAEERFALSPTAWLLDCGRAAAGIGRFGNPILLAG